MTDESPDTGDALLDLAVFASVAALSIVGGIVAGHALTERLRRKDNEQKEEMER